MTKLIPFAKQSVKRMRQRGKYAKGWPIGAIVHFTAGRDGAQKTIDGGISQGYTYLCIQKDGVIVQAHDVDQWGYHAGESAWGSLAKKALEKIGLGSTFKAISGSVSDDLIGIEMNAAGKVDKLSDGTYRTWFKTILHEKDVRYTPGVANQEKGFYEKYTPEQEATLIKTLLWLKTQAPDVFDFDRVLGHDEVAGMRGIGRYRKNDPGAALSMTMDQFRAKLKEEWAKQNHVK